MRVVIQDNYDKMCLWAADHVRKRIEEHNRGSRDGRPFVLGLPTGSSPIGVYKELILINGHNKARALAAAVEGAVSSKWTCSALQLHNNAIIACDEPACGELTVDSYKYFLDIEKKERL